VLQICQKHNLASGHKIEAGYPGTCAVFIVDEQVVVKLYPPMLPDDFHKEVAVYKALRGRQNDHLPQIPALLAYGEVEDGVVWPYLCLEFRSGTAIRELHSSLSQANRTELAQTLGAMLQIVHQTPLDQLDHFCTLPASWQHFVQERQRTILDELREETTLSEPLIHEIGDFLAEMQPMLLQDAEYLHLINGDLTEDHLLLVEDEKVYKNRLQISALIDWADAEVGPIGYEWVALWFSLCNRNQAMFTTLLQAYDPKFVWDTEFSRQMLAYTLIHRFGAGIIGHIEKADGNPTIHSLAALQAWLWPLL